MHLRWFGTANICITHEGKSVIFDPFITRNAQIKCVSVEELADMGNIFLTHGHFDHAMDVPAIVSSGNSKVYCSRDTKNLLIKENVPNSRITAIQPGDIIENDPFRIRVFAGEHVKPDRALLLRTFINPQILLNFRTFCSFMRVHKKFDMGQMLAYQIEAGGKTIFHFGSLNLSMNEEYPQGVDLMTIPFQGRSDLDNYTLQFVERIKPKNIFLHHYDDSFPPVSRKIDSIHFIEMIYKYFSGIKVIVPEYLKAYNL